MVHFVRRLKCQEKNSCQKLGKKSRKYLILVLSGFRIEITGNKNCIGLSIFEEDE